MDYDSVFKPELRKMYAAHGRNPVNDAAIGVIWDRVKTMPNAFMEWAALQTADEDKLPGNLGLELERVLFPRWYAQNKQQQARPSYCPDCDTSLPSPGFFHVWQRLPNGDIGRFMQKCCYYGKDFQKEERMTKTQAMARGFIVMPPGRTDVLEFDRELRGGPVPAPLVMGKFIEAAKAREGEARREHLDELEALGF